VTGAILHHYTYVYQALNAWPLIISVVLGVIGLLFVMIGMEGEGVAFLVGLLVWACVCFPAFLMDWHHPQRLHGTKIEVVLPGSGERVWVPAVRQPDGTWWPAHGRAVK